MSYEYKAKMMLGAIQDAKDDYINATSEEDKEEYRFEITQLENLKVLYEDAAKADEYEAKAKLADDIITAWKTGDFDFTEGEGSLPDHGIAPVPNYHMFDFGQYVDSLLDEYESGEPNAKK